MYHRLSIMLMQYAHILFYYCVFIFTANCVGRVVLQGQLYEHAGNKHLRFTTMTIKVKVGGGRGYLENLFNGDRILGKNLLF